MPYRWRWSGEPDPLGRPGIARVAQTKPDAGAGERGPATAAVHVSQANLPGKRSTRSWSQIAADGNLAAMSLRVLRLSSAPYYGWCKGQVIEPELTETYRAGALFDARRGPTIDWRHAARTSSLLHCRRTRCTAAGGALRRADRAISIGIRDNHEPGRHRGCI